MIRSLASFAVLLAVVAPQAQVTEGKPPIASDWERARTLAERSRSKAYRLSVEPQWIGDSGDFWVMDRGPEGKTFVRVSPAAKSQAPAFDHEALAAALAKEASRTVRARDLPFNSIAPGDGGSWTFTAFDQRWRWRDADKSLTKAEAAPVGGRSGGGPQNVSPDGKWRFGRSNDDLTATNTATGETKRLTEDGSPTASWSNARWSPNSKHLFATRVLAGDRLDMVRIESVPREGFRPRVITQRYALPGDKLDQFELWVFDVESGSRVKVQADPVEDFYSGPPQPNWTSDGKSFRYAHLYRGYQRWVVRSVDAATGEATTLIDESTLTRIQPYLQSVQFLSDKEMLVVSERSGWNHIYLHDASTGNPLRALTHGNWAVRNIVRVEAEARRVVFLANGREPGDPYHVHAYAVGLDGGPIVRLTGPQGHHTVSWSPGGRYLVDTQSTVQSPPTHTVRDAQTGEALLSLPGAAIEGLEGEGWRAPTPFVAKARDGATDLYGLIWFPSHLKPNWKYPVVEYIYAGPHDAHVPKGFMATDRNRTLAELGVIVVQVDALGTGRRGKAFSDHSHKNLGDAGLDDRIGWMRAAAEKHPQMDLTRVGIYGYSAGGYDSTRALLARPEFYKAAVSLCGNHDHRTDKVWWNELWMGYPVGPEYADQSNIENAKNLQGKLLLIAGELDDNVNPHAATLRLVDALVKADKDFDMLFLPGRNHNLGGWYIDRRIYRHFLDHLGVGRPPRLGPTMRSDAKPTSKARTTLVVAVTGAVGAGKSSLASHLAQTNGGRVGGWVAEAGARDVEGRGAANYTWHHLHDGQRRVFAVRAEQGYTFDLSQVDEARAWLETLEPGKPLDLLVTDEFGRAEAAGGGWAPCIPAILRAEPHVWLICLKEGMLGELETAIGRRVDAVIHADDPEAEERFRRLVAERGDWETVGVWGATGGGIEMSLGSALHAGLVPMRGLVLSTMQAVLLTRATERLGRRDRVVWVSFIAAGMKALSPAGNRLRPMMAITIQGLLYRMAVRALGWSRLGAAVGGALVGMWAVSQGILLNLLFLGGDLTRAFDEAMKWLGSRLGVQTPTFWAAVSVWVALWGVAAGSVTAWAYGRPSAGERWLPKKPLTVGVTSGSKRTFLGALSGALRDLARPTFWLPVLIVAAILTGAGRPWEGTMWMALRAATIAFALFVAVRWLDPVGFADWLRQRGHWGPAVAFGRALDGLQRTRR